MGLNSFWLKWIAIITMVIDHTGAVLFPYEIGFRIVGRISFPVFCFLIVEGFVHTSNVRRYLTRLLVFAVISEIPYDLAFSGTAFALERQNVFFTLALGLLVLYIWERSTGNFVRAAELFLVMCAAEFLHTDYGGGGVLLIFIYYIFREKRVWSVAAGAAWNPLLYGIGHVQCYGALAAPFLALYNGKRGPKVKYFFYVFYPLHLLVLYVIKKYFR